MAATGHVTPGLNEPLVGKGLPPFFNPKDAITNWVQVHVGDNDARFGRFLFFVPDFTARLDQIAFAERSLQVKSTFSASVLSVSVLATDGRTTFRKTKPLQKTQRFKLMANPTSLRIFITNEQGEIVDSFAEQEAWTTRERVIFAGARYPSEAMELIRRGESDTVEFKPYIRLDDVKKAAELVKAVISFANTRGGTIFVGVSDDAEILGVEGHMPHDRKKAASFEADFFTAVRNLLKQKLNRIPPIDTRTERIGDKTLFVLQVAEGTVKPYTNIQTRETFVRRGASDMRPDPDTELRQMLVSSGNPLTFI
jgi:Schlafen, AlbA_2